MNLGSPAIQRRSAQNDVPAAPIGRAEPAGRTTMLVRTAAAACAAVILTALLAELVHQPNNKTWFALGLYGAAWAVFAAGAWLLRGVPVRAAAVLILLGCAAAGVACASAPERTSDDLYRYVWDGRVQAAGIDPYEYVPTAPQLAGLRDAFLFPDRTTSWCVKPGTVDRDQAGTTLDPGCTLINRPTVHTIYPPVAEAYFYGVYELSPADARYKPIQLAAVGLAVATSLLLLLGLRSLGRDPRLAALWAWCPLVVYQSGNNAHVDVLGAFFAVGALVVLARPALGRWGRIGGGVLLGLGIGAKFTPAVVAPAALRRRVLVSGGAAAATLALSYLPHVLAVGGKVIGYIPGYFSEQGYQSGSAYLLLNAVLPHSASNIAAALIIAVTVAAVYFTADPLQPWRGAVVTMGVMLLITTPIYPWYAILLVAFVALDGRFEWLALALAVQVGWVAGTAVHMPGTDSQRIGYSLAGLVVLAGTLVRLARARRARRFEAADPVRAAELELELASLAPGAPRVDVVLPCLDESEALPYVLGRLPADYRAIVVDNGSTDGSAQIAAGLGALVVHEPRRGFGSACHAGLVAATAPVVCFCDCDGSMDPEQLPRVADPVLGGRADLVLGRRRPLTSGAWPPHARIANLLLAFRLRRKGVDVRDLGPMRAARREALLGLEVADRRSGYPLETVLSAAASRWRISETDIDYAPRSGKSKVTGTVSGTVTAVRDMSRVWREATR
jgi:hypothetical protein